MKISELILRDAMIKLFHKFGLKIDDAKIVTNCLMDAELAGISTHGISMVPEHIKKLKNGYSLKAELVIKKSTSAFTVCDAENAIGMLSAWKCMEIAIEKACISGIHMVLCNNANTFSAAYCYAKYAVENGKIAFISCNSPAQMAPLGGKEKMLGTNPLAIGIPAKDQAPFILDMATSAVAKSKINQAIHNGDEKIPFGWASDINGIPTDNPHEAVRGLILPMAGPKGYGQCMAIDIIAGVLSHASYLDNVGRFYSKDNQCMNVGHFFVVIDPKIVYGENFYSEMDLYFRRVRTSPSATSTPVLVPGDLNMKYRNDKIKNGIELPEKVITELNELLIANEFEELSI
ncbi:Ldh family oxidoreductase [Robinsoniella peoriensis]|uniref:Ldh family oxidoreductase n=1 Tax=Robinsoniella peoriensis TaxID=180332 RepID=UPI0005C7E62F|nr:Ldh family oxidoreductase [Robinsoniella peoriensis]